MPSMSVIINYFDCDNIERLGIILGLCQSILKFKKIDIVEIAKKMSN
jgi:hypothetical protein